MSLYIVLLSQNVVTPCAFIVIYFTAFAESLTNKHIDTGNFSLNGQGNNFCFSFSFVICSKFYCVICFDKMPNIRHTPLVNTIAYFRWQINFRYDVIPVFGQFNVATWSPWIRLGIHTHPVIRASGGGLCGQKVSTGTDLTNHTTRRQQFTAGGKNQPWTFCAAAFSLPRIVAFQTRTWLVQELVH